MSRDRVPAHYMLSKPGQLIAKDTRRPRKELEGRLVLLGHSNVARVRPVCPATCEVCPYRPATADGYARIYPQEQMYDRVVDQFDLPIPSGSFDDGAFRKHAVRGQGHAKDDGRKHVAQPTTLAFEDADRSTSCAPRPHRRPGGGRPRLVTCAPLSSITGSRASLMLFSEIGLTLAATESRSLISPMAQTLCCCSYNCRVCMAMMVVGTRYRQLSEILKTCTNVIDLMQ